MNRYVILALLVSFVVAYRIILNSAIKKLSASVKPNAVRTRLERVLTPEQLKVYDEWSDSGNIRRGAKNDYVPLAADTTENEKTEFPDTLEELFDGLSEEEASDILDKVLSEREETDKA